MCGELDQSHFARRISPDDVELSMAQVLMIHGVEPIITRELLQHRGLPIRLMRQGPWQERDGLGCPHQGTGQLADHQVRGLWGRFFVFRIRDGEHMARILDQSMLKPASGAQEGPALFPRELNGVQRALHAVVRTAWCTPQGIKALQCGLTVRLSEGRGGQPHRVDHHREGTGRMAERLIGRDMRTKLGIKVANDPKAQWCVHAVFLLIAAL
jgi:hypothetical protein